MKKCPYVYIWRHSCTGNKIFHECPLAKIFFLFHFFFLFRYYYGGCFYGRDRFACVFRLLHLYSILNNTLNLQIEMYVIKETSLSCVASSHRRIKLSKGAKWTGWKQSGWAFFFFFFFVFLSHFALHYANVGKNYYYTHIYIKLMFFHPNCATKFIMVFKRNIQKTGSTATLFFFFCFVNEIFFSMTFFCNFFFF